jgi:hypothetical protein
VRRKLPEIRALGAEVYAIGSGDLEDLRWFLERQKPEHPLWTSPNLAAYDGAGLVRKMTAVYGPKAVLGYAAAVTRGFTNQGGVKGNVLQQGGALVVMKGGGLAFRHANQFNGDHVDPERIVEELKNATSSAR